MLWLTFSVRHMCQVGWNRVLQEHVRSYLDLGLGHRVADVGESIGRWPVREEVRRHIMTIVKPWHPHHRCYKLCIIVGSIQNHLSFPCSPGRFQ